MAMKKTFVKMEKFFKVFGPGVITGAADDDPSGIATYTQTGANFGYGQLWTVIAMLPLMTAIQEACARIGAGTGHGLTAVIKTNYSKKILYSAVLLCACCQYNQYWRGYWRSRSRGPTAYSHQFRHIGFGFYNSDFSFRNFRLLPGLLTCFNVVGLISTCLSAHGLYYSSALADSYYRYCFAARRIQF